MMIRRKYDSCRRHVGILLHLNNKCILIFITTQFYDNDSTQLHITKPVVS